MRYLLLSCNLLLLATGQVLFKLTAATSYVSRWEFVLSPTFLLAMVVYAAATVCWIFVLRAWPLNIAYPTQAIAVAIVVLCGRYLFDETLTFTQIGGIIAIIGGVVLLAGA
jgi:multidrug transporter EmrE-like cation transporter